MRALPRALLPIAAVVLLALTPREAAAGKPEEARKHFRVGVSLLHDPGEPRVEEAYAEFKKAYAIWPSPKILGNLALCAMKMERDGEAIEAYRTYLGGAGDLSAEERTQVQRDLETLETTTVRLTLAVDVPSARLLDTRTNAQGSHIANVYEIQGGTIAIGVHPGNHDLRITAEGREPRLISLTLAPGERISRRVSFEPVATVQRPPNAPAAPAEVPRTTTTRTVPWLLVGIGGAAVATGVITGIVALQKESDLASRCPGGACPPGVDALAERREGKTLVVLTDAMLIGGATLAAAGAAWLLFSPSREAPKTAVSAACTGRGCFGEVRVPF